MNCSTCKHSGNKQLMTVECVHPANWWREKKFSIQTLSHKCEHYELDETKRAGIYSIAAKFDE